MFNLGGETPAKPRRSEALFDHWYAKRKLILMNDERDAGQTELTVRGPTSADSPFLHDLQPHCIDESQVLIREPTQQFCSGLDVGFPCRDDLQEAHLLDHCKKLKSPCPVVALEKPRMAFGHNEGARDQRWWRGEESLEEGVEAVRPVREGDQRRRIDIGFGFLNPLMLSNARSCSGPLRSVM